jgi:tetratricopeptide (TPR) repeat protein
VLLAAVDHATAAGFDIHAGQLAWTLWSFLNRRAHWHDQVSTGRAAVAAAQRLADPTVQALARRNLANAYTELGRYDDADTQLRHALDLATRASDQTSQAHTHYRLAHLWERRSHPAQALHHAQQALRLYQAGDHQAQADALNAVGWFHTLLGDHRQALTYCQQALPLFQELGNRVGEAATWDSLGCAHHHLGQHTRALTCYQHALTLIRSLGGRYYEADTLTRIGDTHHATGDCPAARDAWQQALTILIDLDHPDTDAVRTKLDTLDAPAGHAPPAGTRGHGPVPRRG